MTLYEIRNLVLRCDPNAQHYWKSQNASSAYTVWREYALLSETADDLHDEAWSFQIDRFTREEFDPVAADIRRALDEADGVAYQYLIDFETTEGTRLIHHIFDCRG